jgi:hypothetical protein
MLLVLVPLVLVPLVLVPPVLALMRRVPLAPSASAWQGVQR